jgi:hypothetical protein
LRQVPAPRDQRYPYRHPFSNNLSPPWLRQAPVPRPTTALPPPPLCPPVSTVATSGAAPRDQHHAVRHPLLCQPASTAAVSGIRATRPAMLDRHPLLHQAASPRGCVGCPRRANNNTLSAFPFSTKPPPPWLRRMPAPREQQRPDHTPSPTIHLPVATSDTHAARPTTT